MGHPAAVEVGSRMLHELLVGRRITPALGSLLRTDARLVRPVVDVQEIRTYGISEERRRQEGQLRH